MNEHEARLAISTRIADVLFDLAQDGMEPDDDVDEMRDALSDAADLIMEALGLEIVSVEGSVVITHLTGLDPNA